MQSHYMQMEALRQRGAAEDFRDAQRRERTRALIDSHRLAAREASLRRQTLVTNSRTDWQHRLRGGLYGMV